jgi:hypothetical protein
MSALPWGCRDFLSLVVSLALLGASAGAKPRQENPDIPNGTILPVRLNKEINTRKARSGQIITARVMQDSPLPGGGKIPAGSTVSGTVLSTTSASSHEKGRITLRFDVLEVHHQKTTITTDLRALASPLEVRLAQIPETAPDFGTPASWATTRQVGGDEVYGWYGVVTDQTSQHVGTSVPDGVLVHVRARPGSRCRGELEGENRVQALWVFSSDACGVYGYDELTIQHAGRSEPRGQIEIMSNKGEVKLREASGLLLRIER